MAGTVEGGNWDAGIDTGPGSWFVVAARNNPAAEGSVRLPLSCFEHETAFHFLMFAAAKDAMASRAAQSFLNSRIERYGKVTDLKIDSKRKTMEATCLLEGELDPITVKVGRYTIDEAGGKKFISASELKCSRPWAQSLMKDFVEGKKVELPSWASAAL